MEMIYQEAKVTAPEETEEFKGFPTYKQDPKPNIFKDLEDQNSILI